MHLLRLPLIKLLAINLAIGVSAAVLMLGGLLLLNPHHLRDLIVADRAGGAAIGLLLFGLIVTFGSVAMGTAIMALGKDKTDRPRGGKPQLTPLRARLTASAPPRHSAEAEPKALQTAVLDSR